MGSGRFLLLLEAAILAHVTCSLIYDDCTHSFPDNGVTFDLSPLTKAGSVTQSYAFKTTTATGAVNIYLANVCKKMSLIRCTGGTHPPNPAVVQIDAAKTCFVLGSLDVEPVWALLNPAEPAAGVKVTYKGGDMCSAPIAAPRQITMEFECDRTVPATQITSELENPTCQYTMRLKSPYACPDAGGMSIGWIFIILAIVMVVVYVGGGIAYNMRTHDAKGFDAVPNLNAWREFGVLVKEGVGYSREVFHERIVPGCKGLFRKNDGFEPVPSGTTAGGAP